MRRQMMGWFGEDVVDAASDVWDATGGEVVDLAVSVFEGLPTYGPLKDLVEGPLRDFAKTAVGRVVFRALATALTGSTAALLGPQLATIFWAAPGLARGDNFVEAWTSEFADRAELTAIYFGAEPAKKLGDQLKLATADFAKTHGIDQWVQEGAKSIANRLGIQEYAAESARNLWNGVMPPRSVDYDLATGERKKSAGALVTFEAGNVQTSVSGKAATALAVASATGSLASARATGGVLQGRWAQPVAPSVTDARPLPAPAVRAVAPVEEKPGNALVLGVVGIVTLGAAWWIWKRA